MTNQASSLNFRLRSFVRRDGRKTPAQERARTALWPRVGLAMEDGFLSYPAVFGRLAPCFLEIGYGNGQSLLALAKAHPEWDFIGVETHQPGIGALCLGVLEQQVDNLRLYDGDVVDVLEKCIPSQSLAGIQIFFPDPWPKRRHHLRRLIQPAFLRLVSAKLQQGASLHLATDWEDYAFHMLNVLSQTDDFINLAGSGSFAKRSPYRPIVTKFERRAEREGRQVWELQWEKR